MNPSQDPTYCLSPGNKVQSVGLLRHDNPLRATTVIPIAFSIMQSKTTDAYIEFFSCLKRVTPDNFVLRRLHVDQEAAILKGVDFAFGNTEILLCQWHLSRSINSYYCKFNFLSVKIMQSKFNTLYRMYMSLIHLPLIDDQIRRAVILILEKERQKHKKSTKKMLYADLKLHFLKLFEQHSKKSTALVGIEGSHFGSCVSYYVRIRINEQSTERLCKIG